MVIADFVVAMLRFNNSKKVLVNLDFCWVFDLRQMRALDEYMQNLGQGRNLDAYKIVQYDSDEARKDLAIQLVVCYTN
ncbi:hypothetical protein WN944_026349 [Citrus x changshan-huyou]|uniref:Uncharacterized protein n=1 Tax=Citrus x changshan-huyou TaxID=2935761 RepID=A0AAP0QEG7_9ROSI